jgi:heme oxygenase
VLRTIPVPLGWHCANGRTELACFKETDKASHVFGWLITAAAVSLGAQFWFSALKNTRHLTGKRT